MRLCRSACIDTGTMKELHSDNGTQNGNCYSILGLYRGYIGIMEKKLETIRVQGLGFVHVQQCSLAIRRQSVLKSCPETSL